MLQLANNPATVFSLETLLTSYHQAHGSDAIIEKNNLKDANTFVEIVLWYREQFSCLIKHHQDGYHDAPVFGRDLFSR